MALRSKRPLTSRPISSRDLPKQPLAEAAHLEVFRRDIGALDGAAGGGGGEAILVGDLRVVAEEAVTPRRWKPATVARFVAGREAMRVFGRIEEPDGPRVVARPLDVAAEVALPAGAERAGADLVLGARPGSRGREAGVEDLARRAVPVVGPREWAATRTPPSARPFDTSTEARRSGTPRAKGAAEPAPPTASRARRDACARRSRRRTRRIRMRPSPGRARRRRLRSTTDRETWRWRRRGARS